MCKEWWITLPHTCIIKFKFIISYPGYYGQNSNKQCTFCDLGWTNLAKTVCNNQKSECDAGSIGNDDTHECETCSSGFANTDHTSCVVANNCGAGYYGKDSNKQCTLCNPG